MSSALSDQFAYRYDVSVADNMADNVTWLIKWLICVIVEQCISQCSIVDATSTRCSTSFLVNIQKL